MGAQKWSVASPEPPPAQKWSVAGEGQITGYKEKTRIALREPVRVEAGQRLGVYLYTPDTYYGVAFHDGNGSPVQGDGLVIHKGMFTQHTPFETALSIDSEGVIFVGSVEYELLPAAAAAAAAAAVAFSAGTMGGAVQ